MKMLLILSVTALTVSAAEVGHTADDGVVAHEWGTFTSVAGPEGNPISWAPLFGAPDLPCFVANVGRGRLLKQSVPGFVRMETPVLYFYSQKPQTLSVHVDFPQGLITEWYPNASKTSDSPNSPVVSPYRDGSIDWNNVTLQPGASPHFPMGKNPSRYYAARETDAAPLQIGNEREKMIFYRGVGTFITPLRPKYLSNGKLQISNYSADVIPLAIVFDRHDGKLGYRTILYLKDPIQVDAPEMHPAAEALPRLQEDLYQTLVASGLYAKEARAMLETWKDSWFEDGTRVFYLVPRSQTDSLLPLTISPAPAKVERVFVARVEVLSPSSREQLQQAVDRGDSAPLEALGRFLEPFARNLSANTRALSTAQTKLQSGSGSATCIP